MYCTHQGNRRSVFFHQAFHKSATIWSNVYGHPDKMTSHEHWGHSSAWSLPLNAGNKFHSLNGKPAYVHVSTYFGQFGLANSSYAELCILFYITGSYNVILDESHFKELLALHVKPPPASSSSECSLIRMGKCTRSPLDPVNRLACPFCAHSELSI